MATQESLSAIDRLNEALERSAYLSKGRILNVLSVLGGLLAWELAARAMPRALILAPPSEVTASLMRLTLDGTLPTALAGTIQAMLVGYVISVSIAIPLGFALAQSKYVLWALGPYIDAVYTTPPIVYLPLVVIWFGLGFQGRVFFVFIFCFFEVLINTFEGVNEVQEKFRSVSRSFGASRWQNQRQVVLPATLPFIFAGLRLGVGRAVRGVIVAEIFLKLVNLGRLLQESGAIINTSVQLAVIITIALMGVVFQRIVLEASRRTIPWYYAQGGEV